MFYFIYILRYQILMCMSCPPPTHSAPPPPLPPTQERNQLVLERLEALRSTDTLSRLERVSAVMSEARALLAAKCALRELNMPPIKGAKGGAKDAR